MVSILVVLSIFQCGSEKSGAWTTSPNDRQSDRTKDFAAWCMGIYEQNAVSMSTWRVRSGWFHDPVFRLMDKAKSIPITIGSQTAWEAIRNDFIEKRSRIRSRRRSVQPPRHIDEHFFLMNSLSGLISDAFCI